MFNGRAPYGSAAALPFVIETCWDDGSEIYVVTKVEAGTTFKLLQPGARVTHWNGITIDRYVRLKANMFNGGNEAASLARSLAFLTYRPLTQLAPPPYESVDLRLTVNGADGEEAYAWRGFDPATEPIYPALGRNVTGFGGDLLLMDLQNIRRIQVAPQSFDAMGAAQPAGAPPSMPVIKGSGAGWHL